MGRQMADGTDARCNGVCRECMRPGTRRIASDRVEARGRCARSLTSSVYRMILSVSEVYKVATNVRSATNAHRHQHQRSGHHNKTGGAAARDRTPRQQEGNTHRSQFGRICCVSGASSEEAAGQEAVFRA